MVKLSSDAQKAIDEAEDRTFDPIPDGFYELTAVEITLSDQPGKSGHHYLRVEYDVLCDANEDATHANAKLWMNLSLSPKAAWRMKEFFDAYGVGADTDTDLLIGKPVQAQVRTTTITAGAREGEPTNEIAALRPTELDMGDTPDI